MSKLRAFIVNSLLMFLLSFLTCCDAVPDTEAEFTITISNLSEGEFATDLSEGVYYTNNKGLPLFFPGSFDFGQGLEQLAEDGISDELFFNLSRNDLIKSLGRFSRTSGNDQVEFVFTASFGDYFNFATMFIESNDAFYAYDEEGILLFEADGSPLNGDITQKVRLWDAGTEENQPPYVGSFQASRQSTNDEGVDTPTQAVRLINDGFIYPDKTSVIKISVTSRIL